MVSYLSVIKRLLLLTSACNSVCLTRFGGELQAAGAEFRLGDGLQEGGILRGCKIGGKLADVACHKVCLLILDQKGDVRLHHINAHLLLETRGRNTTFKNVNP